MESIAVDAWGPRVLKTMRVIAISSAGFALLQYLALRLLERQDSCLAFIALSPLMTLAVGVTIAGATAIFASFAAKFDHLVKPNIRHLYRLIFLVGVPVALVLFYLFTEFVPLVETYLTDPDVFCD
jgi:hypothetical protein